MHLILIAIAPIVILLTYVYYRDKYEKEPISLLLKGLFLGMFIVIPIIFAEQLMSNIGNLVTDRHLIKTAWRAFMVAALCEEVFKLAAVGLLVWRNPNFNEKFDGIVYAVFVSLGFALVENIMYVTNGSGGLQVGLIRAFTAVPAHASFGVIMGYYLGLAKFSDKWKSTYTTLAFIMPFLFHGLYDFILMLEHSMLLLGFIPFIIWLFLRAKRRMKTLSDASVFRP